jgi:tRNA pseudouridine-54 N-methylase
MVTDLDTSKVTVHTGNKISLIHAEDIRLLPSVMFKPLKKALEDITNAKWPQTASKKVHVSEVFLLEFVKLFRHYREHIVIQEDGIRVFKVHSRTLSLEGL